MTEARLKISASELGSVLGCFSRGRQYSSVVTLWKKSGLPQSHQSQTDGWRFYQTKQDFLRQSGAADAWAIMCQEAPRACTQEHIETLLEAGFILLFASEFVLRRQKQALEYIGGCQVSITPEIRKTVCTLILMTTAAFAKQEEAVPELTEFSDSCELIGLLPFLKVLKSGRQTFLGLRTLAHCGYGRNAEKMYVKQYNAHMEAPISQPTQTYSKDASIKTKTGFSWRVDGRLDGRLDNGQLIEIKHRTGKGFKQIPLYELMQLHAYMYIFEKKSMKIIQCVRRNTEMVSDTTVIFFNAAFWEDICKRIANVFDFIEELSRSQAGQECFFLLGEAEKEALMERMFPALKEFNQAEYNKFLEPA